LRAEERRRESMYYRIAIQRDPSLPWQWKSTVLSELAAVFQWLRLYRTLPQAILRVFSCSSREELNEQLVRVNQGRVSTSVTAAHFLHERGISSPGLVWGAPADEPPRNERATSIAVVTEPPLGESDREAWPLAERGVSFLEQRRGELEWGAGGDHDCPYRFTLPGSMPQVLAWVKLLVRVQDGM
jgi:hypothetical protein